MTSRTLTGRIGAPLVACLVVMIVAAVALNWMYARFVTEPTQLAIEQNHQVVMEMVGLRDPVTNRLDARFVDANADLVADAPTDARQHVDPETLVFCYVATDDAETFRAQWRPFTDHLARVTGKTVEYATFTDPREQLRALRDERLHVAGLNTGNVPAAVNACGFVPVCKLPSTDGTGMSRMRLIVLTDSPIRAPADVRGRELTLTHPNSNSGYKAALVLLRSDFGLEPSRDYTIRTSGGHEQSIAGIVDGTYQIAAVSDDVLNRALAGGQIEREQYRSVYESEPFPTAGLGYAYNLSPALAAKIREAMTTFDWKDTALAQTLGSAGGTKFVPANYKNDWSLIRRIDDASGEAYQVEAAAAPATKPESEIRNPNDE